MDNVYLEMWFEELFIQLMEELFELGVERRYEIWTTDINVKIIDIVKVKCW